MQKQMLKKFKDKEGFVENIELSRSTIYFKVRLYKWSKKFAALKNSSFSSNYFKNNFKVIKMVCSSNEKLFL